MTGDARRVFGGFTTPSNAPLTENERGWIEFLRLLTGDRDPPVTLAGVQALRAALEER